MQWSFKPAQVRISFPPFPIRGELTGASSIDLSFPIVRFRYLHSIPVTA